MAGSVERVKARSGKTFHAEGGREGHYSLTVVLGTAAMRVRFGRSLVQVFRLERWPKRSGRGDALNEKHAARRSGKMREGERAERWRYRRAPRRMRADADSARVMRPPEEGVLGGLAENRRGCGGL